MRGGAPFVPFVFALEEVFSVMGSVSEVVELELDRRARFRARAA